MSNCCSQYATESVLSEQNAEFCNVKSGGGYIQLNNAVI